MSAAHVERRILDLAIAVAIREGRYPLPEPAICAFAIGEAGETCRRCGATWQQHHTVTIALHEPAARRRSKK